MRKQFRRLFALFLLSFILFSAASASNSEPIIQILHPNAQIIFHSGGRGQFSVTYTNPMIRKHSQYAILLIESPYSGGLPEPDALLYIDQEEAAADGSIAFPNVYPTELCDSALVLTGLDAPVVLAEISTPRARADVSDKITFSPVASTVTYTGAPIPLSALVSPAALDGNSNGMTYLLDGRPATLDTTVTDAGTYTVTARYEDETQTGEKTVTAVIEKAVVPTPAAVPNLIYTGQEQLGISENNYYKTKNDRAVEAGNYIAAAALTDEQNFRWDDPAFDGRVPWSIAKAPSRTITVTRGLRCDDSSPQTITAEDISVQLPGACAITLSDFAFSGDPILGNVSAAADQAITYSLKPGLTAMDTDQTATIAVHFISTNFAESIYKLTIVVPKKADVSDKLVFPDAVYQKIYNGACQTLETADYHGEPIGESRLTYHYSADPIHVGDYTVTAIYEDAASRGTAQAILRIMPAELRVTASEEIGLSKTYDGASDAPIPEIRFEPVGTIHDWPQTAPAAHDYTITAHYVDASGTETSAAGEGKTVHAVIDLKDTNTSKNYRLANPHLYLSGASIEPKPILVSLSGPADCTYSGKAVTPNPTINAVGLIANDTLIPGKDFSVSYADNLHAGTAAVRVRPTDGSNYTFAQAETHFLIRKATHEKVTFRDTVFTNSARGKQTKKIILSELLNGLEGAKLGTPAIETANRMAESAACSGQTLTIGYTPREKGTTAALKIPVSSTDYETFFIEITLTASDIPAVTDSVRTEITRIDGQKTAVSALNLAPRVKNGSAALSISEDEIDEILTELAASAEPQKISVLRLSLDMRTGKSIDETALTLPRRVVRKMGEQDIDLQLITDLGTVRWNAGALAQLAKDSSSGTMIFTLLADGTNRYTVCARSGKEQLDDLGRGRVFLTLPYASENEDTLRVYFTDTGSALEDFDYNAKQETLSFSYDVPGAFQITEAEEVFPQTAPQFAQFHDVPPDHWAALYIYDLAGRGIIAGKGNGQFAPDEQVTREQFVQMLFTAGGSPPSGSFAGFADISPDRWSAPAIAWASSRNIVFGKSAMIFAPTDTITRQEIAAILQRYTLSEGRTLSTVQPVSPFLDQEEISYWAVDAVAAMRQAGIISGADDYFAPNAIATRAECAKMLSLLLTAMK